ncbi:protein BEX3 isoform X1 [Equus quagga]|uniref:protein BEX3 isoform X1 n=1 Tax=Equus quagga TaxID=89248 RepID=UPI001EE174FA|nr:protein BEX3 isoform X1 [Equus quagga]
MSDKALRAGAPRANRQRQRLVCACACAGGGGAFLQHWPPELGGELGSDAGPSRDRELQSDAAFRAVVTPVWVPAPRCPAHGGLASGPGKRSRSAGPSVKCRGGSLGARIGRRRRRQG